LQQYQKWDGCEEKLFVTISEVEEREKNYFNNIRSGILPIKRP
jgi:hypothetical protein